ncbi:YhcB family protein [Chromohalobacter sarecensis]|uniref:Z-ring associated protein G n=1 Tax=Chromohalobacter sarecensis TaxID=245294 RepID=A0ABV9D3K5_9GAMM|nr:YhcB family protein [Chromohalobacter sarecensis]
MNESNIDWILAIACFLAGIGIGALGYHLLNANVARNQKVRQRLAETELELSQVKDALNDHFTKASELVTSIQRQSHELEQQLSQGADRLVDDLQLKRRLHPRQEGETQEEDTDPPQMPRDYAEGAQGTLSENYGLEPRNQRATETETPQRY